MFLQGILVVLFFFLPDWRFLRRVTAGGGKDRTCDWSAIIYFEVRSVCVNPSFKMYMFGPLLPPPTRPPPPQPQVDIPEGSLIGEYVGEVMSEDDWQERQVHGWTKQLYVLMWILRARRCGCVAHRPFHFAVWYVVVVFKNDVAMV